jgi:hypothetical protein
MVSRHGSQLKIVIDKLVPIELAASCDIGLVSLWYCPPELLLKAADRSFASVMWEVGLNVAQIMRKGRALFAGDSEIDQIFRIFR